MLDTIEGLKKQKLNLLPSYNWHTIENVFCCFLFVNNLISKVISKEWFYEDLLSTTTKTTKIPETKTLLFKVILLLTLEN